MKKENHIPFDFAAWRARLGWSKEQVCQALGVSRTYYWQIEKAGAGSRMAAWAAYGLEHYTGRDNETPGL